MKESAKIADATLAHLGGAKFVSSTKAKNFVHDTKGQLSFQVPPAAAFGITHVQVALKENALYEMRFLRIATGRTMVISGHLNVPADQLRRVFESTTGLKGQP